MIKTVVFDMGGVVIDLCYERAVKRFKEIGIPDIETMLDPYVQRDCFKQLEAGSISPEEYCETLSKRYGKTFTREEIEYAWLGLVSGVSQYKLDYIQSLRGHYKVYLLSNTNPYVFGWALSDKFSEAGRGIGSYFDKMYVSYMLGTMKPDPAFFEHMIKDSGLVPAETLFVDDSAHNCEVGRSFGLQTCQPENGSDWRDAVTRCLKSM